MSPLIVPLLYPGFGRVTEFLRPHFRITCRDLAVWSYNKSRVADYPPRTSPVTSQNTDFWIQSSAKRRLQPLSHLLL